MTGELPADLAVLKRGVGEQVWLGCCGLLGGCNSNDGECGGERNGLRDDVCFHSLTFLLFYLPG